MNLEELQEEGNIWRSSRHFEFVLKVNIEIYNFSFCFTLLGRKVKQNSAGESLPCHQYNVEC